MFKARISKILPILLLTNLFYPSPIISAQETEAEELRREKLENSVREIGLAAGYATQCYLSQENQEEVERIGDEALAVAEIILQDFGSTLAFLFTSNAGYAAGKPTDLTECGQLIKDWQAIVESLSDEDE